MKEILKIALGVFLGGGALLIVHAFVDDVRFNSRALDLTRHMTVPQALLPAAPAAPADLCTASKDPACGIVPSAKSVSCVIKGESWRMAENLCLARGGKIE